jgi:hypothetical protein
MNLNTRRITQITTRLESTNDIAKNKNRWIVGSMSDTLGMSVANHPAVHFTQESARKEADRLAQNDPGKYFVILQISGASVANSITHI